jgi:hypothetical protein
MRHQKNDFYHTHNTKTGGVNVRIIDKPKFILGIFELLAGICLIFTCIYLRRTSRLVFAFFPIFCGIGMILSNIETRAERQKRKEELMQMFKDRIKDTSDTSSDSELKD